jgi:hypothetical protein
LSATNAPTDASALFQQFVAARKEIESCIGTELIFREVKSGLYHVGGMKLLDADPANEEDWGRQHRWLGEAVSKLYDCFGRRITAWVDATRA